MEIRQLETMGVNGKYAIMSKRVFYLKLLVIIFSGIASIGSIVLVAVYRK